MFKFLRLFIVWAIVFILIFSVLELGSIFYIHYFLDEEEFGHYASVKQIVNRMRKK
ncbi:MAG: hypothetical protein ACP5UA_12665 [Candidatus Hydrogenedens sp.]